MNEFNTIQAALDDLKQGKMLIVLDDAKRENQADLIFAAEFVNINKINFLVNQCRGQICVPITLEKAKQLELQLMIDSVNNTEKTGVNFTVTVDAKDVTSFGISTEDRVKTIKTINYLNSRPDDLVRPGHVFPLLARKGGVLERPGHTEATIDLLKSADLSPVGVICEILNDKGVVANSSELREFSRKFDTKIINVSDLILFIKSLKGKNKNRSSSVIKKASSSLPTSYGNFKISIYQSYPDKREHAVLILGDIKNKPVLTRIHSKCFTGDIFYSLKCDCHEQLKKSLKIIQEERNGIIIYLDQEGRGIGLTQKIKAYALQDQGYDTVEANNLLGFSSDEREYTIAADILNDLGITDINLLTNNPEKLSQIQKMGIKITQRIPLEIIPQEYNIKYLKAKKQKLKHLLTNV